MSAAVIGLLFGVGAACVLSAVTAAPERRGARTPSPLEGLIADAGAHRLSPSSVVGACVGCALLAGIGTYALSGGIVVATAFAAFAASAPVAWLRRRALRRRVLMRGVWPDVVDDLASAVRAGLSLPEALAQAGSRAHPAVAPAFTAFAAEHRAAGTFAEALDRLKDRLADPVADRIVESLRLAREVGGADLGRLLRTLSTFLRDDLRLRGELEVRQGWTVNAARLAAAAPWVTLGLLALRPAAVQAYDTAAGAAVLAAGAVITVVAYRLMVVLGRLPQDPRVLR